jgi:hypothetical protein
MATTRGMPAARPLRAHLSAVASLVELDDLIERHLAAYRDAFSNAATLH